MERRKEVRLEHIASEVGVSIVTVSNALKGKKGVSEELRNIICDTAARMGYRVEEAVQKKHASYTVGIAVAERYVKEFPSFYMDVYRCAAEELTKLGSMSVFEVISEEQEKRQSDPAAFSGVEISGIMLIGETDRKYVEVLKRACGLPMVCIDFYDVREDIEYVVTDNFGGMEQVTERLLDTGCKSVTFLGDPNRSGNVMDRYLGYCKALEKRGLRPEYLSCPLCGHSDEEKPEIKLPSVLPEAFVCENDACAGALLEKLSESGIEVADQVAVTGFGHKHSRMQAGADLTAYENDEKVLAHIGVRTLLRQLEGKKKTQGIRIVEGRIVRGSTAALSGGEERRAERREGKES